MKHAIKLVPIFAVAIWLSTMNPSLAQLPEDVRKLLDEHLVGLWATESTVGASKQTGSASINWDAGGRSLTNRWQVRDEKGVTFITELIGWDAASNSILVQGFDSQGNTWTIHWNRPTADKPTELTGRGVGTLEGQKWESPTKIQFSKDAYRYEDVTGGTAYVLNAKRKDSGEQEYRAWFKYLEGTWNCEEGTGNNGTVVFRKAGVAPGLVFQVELTKYSIAGVMGWDADSKMIVETGYFGNRLGGTGTMHREYSEITMETLKGLDKFRFTSGITGNGAIENRRISQDEMTLTGVDFDGTKWTAKFKRAR